MIYILNYFSMKNSNHEPCSKLRHIFTSSPFSSYEADLNISYQFSNLCDLSI